MEIIDGHIHLDDGASALVTKAAGAEGASKWCVLSLSQLYDDPVQNPAALYAKALEPERCFAFCGLDHPKAGEPAADYAAQLQAWLDAGFDGLKLIETKPNCAKNTGVRLDGACFDAMFARCGERQIPILWHVGDPASFWDPEKCPPSAAENGWAYTDGSFLPLRELYAMTENVLDRRPKLKVTFAHFYFTSDDPDHARRMMERYPNVRFDLTPGTEMYGGFTENPAAFRPFFLKYADRIQFGTDTDVYSTGNQSYSSGTRDKVLRFLATQDEYEFWGFRVKGFALPEAAVEQIMAGTFRTFAGEAPKPLCREAALAACGRTEALLAERKDARAGQAGLLRDKIAEAVR